MNKFSPKDLNILYNNILVLKNIYKDLKKDKYLLNYFGEKLNKDFEKQTKIYEDFIKKHFILNKINNIDDLSPERLNNFSLDNICFINKSINNELDSKIKNCIDSREQFEALREYFSEIIKQFEKTSKTVKTNDFVKIHETPKMDPMLIGTKRRISLLKNMISKNIESNIDITYTSKYSNNIETFKLDVSSIDFKPHGGNQSNSIIISEQINKLSHTIQNAKDVLITNIITVYKEIISNFRKLILDDKNNDEFLFINNLISLAKECDILQCKAYLATKYNYCKPEIVESDESFVEVEKIRHCLIEQLNNQELYVTNDFDLGITQKGILLYGTNAVGKTSFIKSIGIAIIMAQAGLFVPASKFRYNPYNYLFTRILGNDNIFKGLSTFAVEMCELRTILKFAQKNSLILGDELCSGTESSSALSIFTAGLEKLHRLQSSFIFATHFHEIINYTEIKNLENLRLYHMSVIYDFKNKCLIYDRKLKSGPGDNMYGLEVCKSLNLPEEFLERAHELRIKYSNQLSILDQDGCKYNKNKIKNMCEICKKQKGTEIHHLQHQKNSINGYINNEFRLNHPANLINICEECHNKIHKNNLEHKVIKTTNGYTIQQI
jgi:DNA mismatch repair protein MutS